MTIKDIAERAGVSMITVSRVINSPERVSKETREKITAILEEVGYVHNTAAHNLASNKSGIICIHMAKTMGMMDPFSQQFLIGACSALSEENYSVQIIDKIKPNQFCDGYILSGYNYKETTLLDAKKTGKPVALLGSYKDPDVDTMDTNNTEAAKIGVEYLIQKGHKKIAIVLNNIDSPYVKERFEGYKEALSDHDIPFCEELVHTVANTVQGGMEAANWVVDNKLDVSAVFFITDIMAVGFISGLRSHGINVPDQISVVGFDGLGHHLMASPKITTVAQPVFETARLLSKCLIDRIQHPEKAVTHTYVDSVLDVEESVKEY